MAQAEASNTSQNSNKISTIPQLNTVSSYTTSSSNDDYSHTTATNNILVGDYCDCAVECYNSKEQHPLNQPHQNLLLVM